MFIELSIYGQRIRALVDSGASKSVLRHAELFALCKLANRIPVLRKSVQLCGVIGHDITVLGSTEICDDKLEPIPVIVVEGIGHAMILGRDVMGH